MQKKYGQATINFVDWCTPFFFFEIYAELANLLWACILEQRRLWLSRSHKRILIRGSFILPSQISERSLPTLQPTLRQRHMNLVSILIPISLTKVNICFLTAWLNHLFFSLVGLASRRPRPKDLVKYAESCMYSPIYRNYRWIQINSSHVQLWTIYYKTSLRTPPDSTLHAVIKLCLPELVQALFLPLRVTCSVVFPLRCDVKMP